MSHTLPQNKTRVRTTTPQRWLLVVLFGLINSLCEVSTTAVCLSAPSGLVGFWPGDGNAKDIVSTNNGTLTGGAVANVAGVVGSAFSFNGTTGYVQVPDAPALKPTNLTVEAWVQLDAFGSTFNSIGEQYIVFKKNTRGGDFEAYALTEVTNASNQHVFHFVVIGAGGTPAQINSSSLVSTGVWYHVAAVRGSNFIQFYVNGALEGQTGVSFPQDYGTLPLYFGTTGRGMMENLRDGWMRCRSTIAHYRRMKLPPSIPPVRQANARRQKSLRSRKVRRFLREAVRASPLRPRD